jgi:hypothetical protein
MAARWSFNGAAVSGFDSAPMGGETKGWDRERKCRRHGSLGGGARVQHDGSRPDGRSGGVGCHTPFRERGNEASIRVPRMFKSHAWQQYDKQMQCY